jgi:hypothetical protein
MHNLLKYLFCIVISVIFCGCIIIKKDSSNSNEKFLIASPQNVYRTSTNIVIKALVQDEKTGNWVEAKYPVLIPSGYYIGSGL